MCFLIKITEEKKNERQTCFSNLYSGTSPATSLYTKAEHPGPKLSWTNIHTTLQVFPRTPLLSNILLSMLVITVVSDILGLWLFLLLVVTVIKVSLEWLFRNYLLSAWKFSVCYLVVWYVLSLVYLSIIMASISILVVIDILLLWALRSTVQGGVGISCILVYCYLIWL